MLPATDKLTALFYKHLEGTLSPLEKQELAAYSMQEELQPLLQHLMDEAWYVTGEEADMQPEKLASTRDILARKRQEEQRTAIRSLVARKWWWAAAGLLLLLATALLFVNRHVNVEAGKAVAEDIHPGTNGAILTLPNGTQVVLNNSTNSSVAKTAHDSSLPTASYTISTTRGKQFQVVLPDGSLAWLNTASSITYPAVFNGHARKVSVTGEVYFEVKTLSAHHPFEVTCDGQTVTVLGTRFNVNSYKDDGMVKTTLRDGKVRVTSYAGNKSAVLKPTQQAQVTAKGDVVVKDVNVDAVIAWQAGFFNLTNVPFQEIMQRLARWYDIAVKYETKVPQIEFEGRLNQSVNLSRVLEFFKESGVKYRLENHTLIIL